MLYQSVAALLAVAVFGRRNDYPQEILGNQIKSLPGLDSATMAKYTMFSGYINVDTSSPRWLFYWFVESLNDPTNDPVVLWTNGGPGCSGLGGMWTEQGPFRVMDNQELEVNPYSWVNAANMIFFEQPAGVGFSYFVNENDKNTGDAKAANDNYHFIQNWLNTFPNFKSNDFYTTSESYGGHYMPTLAKRIVEGNNAGGNPQINYKGFFVGNPYTDPSENAKGMYDTWYGHQLVSQPAWHSWFQACKDGKEGGLRCDEALGVLHEQVGNIDPYALDYPVCNQKLYKRYWFLKHVVRDALKRPLPKYYELLAQDHDEIKLKRMNASPEDLKSGNFPSPAYQSCASAYSTEWLNRADVQHAIFVNASETGIWHDCSESINYNRTDSSVPMEPYYQWLISNSDLRITVVSGDDDSVCGSIGTQSWIFNLGYKINHDVNWQAWMDDNNQVGGFHTQFVTNTTAKFKFVTVHGAGHMIPQTEGARSLITFKNYLSGVF